MKIYENGTYRDMTAEEAAAIEDGRYYVQDGVVYRCTRNTGNAVFQPLAELAELAGIYVEVVGT